ncbi:unnamed protein product (macronuclear) [Paramecium tetraurelia]|uniref:RGS domain-containing protein n=1 Tax=Paramecium tetraurelia TaxID=5888 RepID=A0D412_PARTE|nr:uncharacterized protein GSPATT00013244001 [Paramecium tetraurelia]CAK77779.1 unnamed protein product [Paramecium tetraurelia]|eukprot:XP_001445176.1 hypothetical protein (macronuclear) [Paramecium tetraurelia strain d4-2]
MNYLENEEGQENLKKIDSNNEDEQYQYTSNEIIPPFKAYISKEQTKMPQQRFYTLINKETNSKNIPKTFGNNFKKFMDNVAIINRGQKSRPPFPQQMERFLNKKNKGKQSTYILKDFQALFSNEICRKWFQFYMENCAFLDLIQSNRIEDVEEFILAIEQYLLGAQDPDNFLLQRKQKHKEAAKLQKIQMKLDEVKQDYDSNIQFISYNEEQSSNFDN